MESTPGKHADIQYSDATQLVTTVNERFEREQADGQGGGGPLPESQVIFHGAFKPNEGVPSPDSEIDWG